MGFFQDLKEDLSQAVNELMDDDSTEKVSADSMKDEAAAEEETVDAANEVVETQEADFSEKTVFEGTYSETKDIETEEDSVDDLLKELDLLKEEKKDKSK